MAKMQRILLPCALLFSCFLGSQPQQGSGKLFIADAVELSQLEASGFSFSEIALGGKKAVPGNSELAKNSDYQQIAHSLGADLEALKKSDKLLGVGMQYSHRLFDPNWLSSPSSFYELIGIVLRLDRAPFIENSCGEVRLIYRLAYRAQGSYSRLPMTFNAVFLAKDEENKSADCTKVALHWQNISQSVRKNKAQLIPGNLKSLEVNMQSVRWPSTVRPDFGGYAEYFLRVFQKSAGKYRPAPLENTPDVKKIKKSSELRDELLAWIKQNLSVIDQGVAVLPEKFLARKVTSVALNGPGRLANLPFRQIFSEADLEGLAQQGKYTASGRWIMRRLDDQSCSGCHQGRAVAGFHFTGADRADTDAVNSIYNAASPHFFADQARREGYVESVASAKPAAVAREISWRSDHESGDFGAFCDTAERSPANFGCAAGHECLALNRDAKLNNPGICQPKKAIAGSACKSGSPSVNINPHKDRITQVKNIPCGAGYGCQNVAVGFPGGMCSNACKNIGSGEVCGSIANLQGFNDCLGERKPFAECLSGNVRPGALKFCDAQHSCRPDYICAKISAGKGGCIPPYFLFQLRVDGHNF